MQWAVSDALLEAMSLGAPHFECAYWAAELVAALVQEHLLAVPVDVVFVSNHGYAEGMLTVFVHVNGDLVELQECGAGHAERAQHAEEGEELGLELAEG